MNRNPAIHRQSSGDIDIADLDSGSPLALTAGGADTAPPDGASPEAGTTGAGLQAGGQAPA